jgi:hypothetical protein
VGIEGPLVEAGLAVLETAALSQPLFPKPGARGQGALSLDEFEVERDDRDPLGTKERRTAMNEGKWASALKRMRIAIL